MLQLWPGLSVQEPWHTSVCLGHVMLLLAWVIIIGCVCLKYQLKCRFWLTSNLEVFILLSGPSIQLRISLFRCIFGDSLFYFWLYFLEQKHPVNTIDNTTFITTLPRKGNFKFQDLFQGFITYHIYLNAFLSKQEHCCNLWGWTSDGFSSLQYRQFGWGFW